MVFIQFNGMEWIKHTKQLRFLFPLQNAVAMVNDVTASTEVLFILSNDPNPFHFCIHYSDIEIP